MDLNLRHLIRLARRWWWLLLLGPLVAGIAAYWATSRQQDLYSATATLTINQAQSGQNQELSGIQAVERLGATYQQLVDTDPVLTQVINDLGLPLTLSELRDNVSASAVTGTQLLRISVSDTDPERSAAIANAVALVFSTSVANQTAELTGASREALDNQIAASEDQIAALNVQIQNLEGDANAGSTEFQGQIASLRVSLNQLQTSYGDLLVRRQEMELNDAAVQNRVTVWEPARVPEAPYAPRVLLYTLLAVVAGLILAAGAVLLIEFLDNTVKSDSPFEELVGAPVLSAISVVPKIQEGHEQLFVLNRPRSNDAEAVRLLRTNIEFAAASKEIATLVVTSPGPGEGKSTITANLALAMAQAGLSTVVIDADLRRPSQHKIFEVPNERGLTTLLTHPNQPWNWASVEVIPGKLYVIPSGPLPPNPADLLSSYRLQELLRTMNQTVDLVILDSPPILAATDPLIIAPNTDGAVLVCQAGATRREALRRAADSLHQGSVRIIGVVLNHQAGRHGESYYYYQGYYGVDTPPNGTAPEGAFGFLRKRRVGQTPDQSPTLPT